MSLTPGREVVFTDSLDAFLAEASKYRLLSAADEIRLAKRIERGDLAAKELLINSNLRLVVHIARKYQGQGLEMADLVQEGMLGLVRAVEKFDWRKGFRFSTYGTIWVRQALQRGLDDSGRTIRLPANVAQRVRRYNRFQRELHVKLEREPTVAELAEATGFSIDEVEYLIVLDDMRPVSGDQGVGDDKETSLFDVLAPTGPLFEEQIVKTLQTKRLHDQLITILDGYGQAGEAVKLRYGLEGPALTLEQAARKMGWTVSMVRMRVDQTLESVAEEFGAVLRQLTDENAIDITPLVRPRPQPVPLQLSERSRRPLPKPERILHSVPDPDEVVREDCLEGLRQLSQVLGHPPRYVDLITVGRLKGRLYTELYRFWESLAEANQRARFG